VSAAPKYTPTLLVRVIFFSGNYFTKSNKWDIILFSYQARIAAVRRYRLESPSASWFTVNMLPAGGGVENGYPEPKQSPPPPQATYFVELGSIIEDL
jgi:hypothetical protein